MREHPAPCYHPNCECCYVWETLDDQRLEEIETLRSRLELATTMSSKLSAEVADLWEFIEDMPGGTDAYDQWKATNE